MSDAFHLTRFSFFPVIAAVLPPAVWEQADAGSPSTPTAASSNHTSHDWLTFGLDRLEILQLRPFADIPLWQFLATPIYVLIAFFASRALDYVIRERIKKFAGSKSRRLVSLLVGLAGGPVKVITFVVLLHIGMRLYDWPAGVSDFLFTGLAILVACSITYVLLKTIDALLDFWRDRITTAENEHFSQQLLPLISKSAKTFVVLVALLVTSQNIGLNVTGLIASLSIGGLALSLAAQDTLATLFGAVAVLIDRPFKVGDRIQLDKTDGTIEGIGFRSTRVRNTDGHLVTIPNKTMGNATITNISSRPYWKTTLDIGIAYNTPVAVVERALQILEEVYRSYPLTQDVIVSFNKFSECSLNLQVVHWCKSTVQREYLAGMQGMNLEIKERFDQAGIEFALPTHITHLRQASRTSIGSVSSREDRDSHVGCLDAAGAPPVRSYVPAGRRASP